MTAAARRLLPETMGQRFVFIAEILKPGETPDTEKQPLSRQETETLRKIAHMLAQAMAATAQSMEAQVGLISLSKSVNTLVQSLGRYSADKSLGAQAQEVRENARDVQNNISQVLQGLGGLKDDTGLKQTLLSSLQQLKDLEPKGKEGQRVVRLVTLRSNRPVVANLATNLSADDKAGAKILPFTKAAAQAGHGDGLRPSTPPLSNNPGDLQGPTKPSLQQGTIQAIEPQTKVSVASGNSISGPLTNLGGNEARQSLIATGAVTPTIQESSIAKASTMAVATVAERSLDRTISISAVVPESKTAPLPMEARTTHQTTVPATLTANSVSPAPQTIVTSVPSYNVTVMAAGIKTESILASPKAQDAGANSLSNTVAVVAHTAPALSIIPRNDAAPVAHTVAATAQASVVSAGADIVRPAEAAIPKTFALAPQTSTPQGATVTAPFDLTTINRQPSIALSDIKIQIPVASGNAVSVPPPAALPAVPSAVHSAMPSAMPPAVPHVQPAPLPATIATATSDKPIAQGNNPVARTVETNSAKVEATAPSTSGVTHKFISDTQVLRDAGISVSVTKPAFDTHTRLDVPRIDTASTRDAPIRHHSDNYNVSMRQATTEQAASAKAFASDPIITRHSEPVRFEPISELPVRTLGGNTSESINPPKNSAGQTAQAPIGKEFKIAAKGACDRCGGGNCAACMRPVTANASSAASRVAALKKG